ncbi:hypothetical protein C8Q79DRAFT_892958, partial [Trametes meyenii]
WMTPEQKSWLEKRIPEFIEAQVTRTTTDFFAAVAYDWFRAFLCPEPTSEELEDAEWDMALAMSEKRKAEKQRIIGWFYNHTRSAKSRRPINLSKRKTGYLHPYQAYMKL